MNLTLYPKNTKQSLRDTFKQYKGEYIEYMAIKNDIDKGHYENEYLQVLNNLKLPELFNIEINRLIMKIIL